MRQVAAAGNDIDGAARHIEPADGADETVVPEQRCSTASTISAAAAAASRRKRHRHGSGVTRETCDRDAVAHAAGDRSHDTERAILVEQHRSLLDVDFDVTEQLASDRGPGA